MTYYRQKAQEELASYFDLYGPQLKTIAILVLFKVILKHDEHAYEYNDFQIQDNLVKRMQFEPVDSEYEALKMIDSIIGYSDDEQIEIIEAKREIQFIIDSLHKDQSTKNLETLKLLALKLDLSFAPGCDIIDL